MKPLSLLAAVILIATLSACGASFPPTQEELTVFAAASLTEAFTQIGQAFEAEHPGGTVRFSFAGSQTLRTQIEQGAAADVFAPANSTEMQKLVDGGLVEDGSAQTLATNQLGVIMPGDNLAEIASLADLGRPGVKLVLAAEEVPAGKYARQMLENLNAAFGPDYKDQVLANVVSNETDVRQVVAKVELGEADAGIVYVSDWVASPGLATLEIPYDANVIAAYPIAPVAGNSHPELGRGFVDFVLSAEGQAALQNWGFGPARAGP